MRPIVSAVFRLCFSWFEKPIGMGIPEPCSPSSSPPPPPSSPPPPPPLPAAPAPRAAAAGAAADAPAWREVRLPACLEGGCALPAALPALSAAALPNASAWCTACGNEQLPVCAAAAAAGRAACAAGAGAASDASSIAPLEVLTLAMSPLLLLALTVVAAWGVYGRCVALRRHAVASGATVPRCAPAGGLQTELREFTDVQISS